MLPVGTGLSLHLCPASPQPEVSTSQHRFSPCPGARGVSLRPTHTLTEGLPGVWLKLSLRGDHVCYYTQGQAPARLVVVKQDAVKYVDPPRMRDTGQRAEDCSWAARTDKHHTSAFSRRKYLSCYLGRGIVWQEANPRRDLGKGQRPDPSPSTTSPPPPKGSACLSPAPSAPTHHLCRWAQQLLEPHPQSHPGPRRWQVPKHCWPGTQQPPRARAAQGSASGNAGFPPSLRAQFGPPGSVSTAGHGCWLCSCSSELLQQRSHRRRALAS